MAPRKAKFVFFIFGMCVLLATGCRSNTSATVKEVARDTTITPANSYSDLFLDSLQVARFLSDRNLPDTVQKIVTNFYNARNYQYAWLSEAGFSEQAFHFHNTLQDYLSYSGDSVLYNPFLHQLLDSTGQDPSLQLTDSTRFRAEMELSLSFLRYARRAYGGTISQRQDDLSWYIPRKRINPVEILDSFMASGKEPSLQEPVNAQYKQLKGHLMRYYQLQRQGGFPPVELTTRSIRKGDSLQAVTALKKRLHSTGDYALADTTALFTPELKLAVARFQSRYGLKEDGIVGGTTLKYLNEPVDIRIRQILVNMERMRWMPELPQGDFVLVNIPQFRLTVFEEGKPAFGMKIVVGTTQNRTVIFTGNMKYVVFAPYWNVPPGILKNEVLPAISKDPSYLERNHMEWNNNTVRQKPGPWNALGQVKFLFPNSYNIYLHDTPAKTLFAENKRAFSHGCIRIEQPEKMARWALRHQKEWTPQRISNAMKRDRELFVTMKEPIPVFIGYFTAWVDSEGKLHFRDDLYGHDSKLAEKMFTK